MVVFIKIYVILRQYSNTTIKYTTNSIKVIYDFFGAKTNFNSINGP